MPKYPISKLCPQCGGSEYTTKAPGGFVPAFTNDRICKACGTRYTPPTPVWAAILFIVVGLVLAGFAVVALLPIISGRSDRVPGCEILLGFMGLACIAYGITSFYQRPVDTPSSGFLAPPSDPDKKK